MNNNENKEDAQETNMWASKCIYIDVEKIFRKSTGNIIMSIILSVAKKFLHPRLGLQQGEHGMSSSAIASSSTSIHDTWKKYGNLMGY